MGDEYQEYWRRVGGEALKAYGDGYADGRCFEAPLAEERGMRAGVAAYEGLMGMARVIGARERARPAAPDPDFRGCNRREPNGSRRCTLVNDHDGPHKKITLGGRVAAVWEMDDRCSTDKSTKAP